VASTPSGRATFAKSSVALLADLGFDGLDIDWEYPATAAQATDMVLLLAAVRRALDGYASANALPYHFLLTVASPAGPSNYDTMHLAMMDRYLDHWNLMAYDYAGTFSDVSGHQANLIPNRQNPAATPFSTSRAVADYISAGIPPAKIILGMPLYGRAFTGTSGPGLPYSGVGDGSWEKGIWDFKDLPRPGAKEKYDGSAGASYSYEEQDKVLVSYDNKREVVRKAGWIVDKGVGGAMWWEASADRVGEGSLVGSVARVFGSDGGLERSENCLDYPTSKYGNLRAGMLGE